MKIKKLISSAFLLFCVFATESVFAKSAYFSNDNYTININYNSEIIPGDAVFVKMTVTQNKSTKKNLFERKANLQLFQNGKLAESSPFYIINSKKVKTTTEFLSGVPVSLWIDSDTADYELKVLLYFSGESPKELSLPVTFRLRNFNEETIPLSEKNTSIRTNTSPERMTQIEKLNDILKTVNSSDVFQYKTFSAPTDSTRYTANCGDRRTYLYSNGKKSTTLHFGNDYGVPTGAEVKSCADGKVMLAEDRISTGLSIVIEHLPGLYSIYYHLSELNVTEGETVKMGQLIGKSGATGMVTGPHLHWEMRLNGSAIIPEFFLKDFVIEK